MFEAAITVLALLMGVTGERCRAARQLWRDRADIRARRAAVQASRSVPDSMLLNGGGVELGGPTGRSRALRAATRATTAVLDGYWRLVRRWL
jgi:hypothetical protein